VRRAPANSDEIFWNPDTGEFDASALRGADAVVDMCGVGVADKRWSGAFKQSLRDSRIGPTEVLAAAVAEHGVPAFVSASAVGYYGNTGDRVTDESGPSGTGFLAEVCRDWEAATQKAVDAGVRVVNLRTGLVLAPAGGLLGVLRPLFKFFLGGRLGPGTQYMPWISLDDEVGGIRHALEHDSVVGPVNLTGPTPATNAEFTKALAEAVHRPTSLPVPAVVIKTVLGAMGEELLLYGQRAVPAQLEKTGYQFRHRTLGDALSAAVEA